MLEIERKAREIRISQGDILKIEDLRKRIKGKNGFGTETLYQELFDVFNKITGGRFLDKRNANHVWNASKNSQYVFDKDQAFDPACLETNRKGNAQFYYSIQGNPYVGADNCNVLLIFTPENRNLIRILKRYLNFIATNKRKERLDVTAEEIDRIKKFVRGEEQLVSGERTSYEWGKILFKVFERGDKRVNIRWSQVASCIVDLNKKKVYFFS